MHISTIHYSESESVETYNGSGLHQWNKKEYGVTVTLQEGDDENHADQLAKDFVKEKLKTNKQTFSEMYYAADEKPLPVIQNNER